MRRRVKHLDGVDAKLLAQPGKGFEENVPVFACLGRATLVGPRGSGQLAKLANQIIVTVTIGAVAEGLMLAAAGGADPGAVRDALRGGYAESRVLEVLGQREPGAVQCVCKSLIWCPLHVPY